MHGYLHHIDTVRIGNIRLPPKYEYMRKISTLCYRI